jgi:hypothetical protein
MKYLPSASMIAIGLLAAAPLAPAHAATRRPITHTRVVHGHLGAPSRFPALGSPSRGGYEAYGYAPSGGYGAYPDGARNSYEERLVETTEDDAY